jgi:hypothetical protein
MQLHYLGARIVFIASLLSVFVSFRSGFAADASVHRRQHRYRAPPLKH